MGDPKNYFEHVLESSKNVLLNNQSGFMIQFVIQKWRVFLDLELENSHFSVFLKIAKSLREDLFRSISDFKLKLL